MLAGLFEIGWPLGLKISQTTSYKAVGILLAIVCMAISGGLLWMAQKQIPIGTAYAAWTEVGAVGTFLVGIIFFHDPAGFWRLLSIFLIIAGIIGLKIAP